MAPTGFIESSALALAMRQSTWLYPAVETVHIVGLALLVGSIAVLDLRLLGLSRSLPVRKLAGHVLPWTLASFALMSYLGVKYLFAKEVKTTSRSAERMEERLHPHTAFMTGFVRTLGNPGVLLLWVALSATFLSHEWVDPNWTSKSICIGGVAAGGLVWFTLLSYVVSIGHRHLSDKTMLNMSRGAGGMMLVAAIALGYKLALLLSQGFKSLPVPAP